MKTIILVSSCILIYLHAHSQTTLIPDADFEQALIDLGYDVPPLNGEILTSSIDTITVLNVAEKQINSLEGIEGFVNLRELICYTNQLSSLNLSQNSLLTHLFCAENNIDSLNLSQNQNLEELLCWSNNMTFIDVSNNPVLSILRCRSNALSEINTSNIPALKFLDCSYNEISSLDVTSNNLLDWLYCYENVLTELDVTQNALLKKLWCRSNQLASLDVSNNANLIHLTCHWNNLTILDVTNNPVLLTLTCSGNNLTELDVSQNSTLIFLYCQNNDLECLNVKNGNNTSFTIFEADGNPNLTCTTVDDVEFSNANWDIIDPWNTFSLECIDCGISNIHVIESAIEFKPYPNPTNDCIMIDFKDVKKKISISVFDLMGNLVSYREEKQISTVNFPIKGPSGTYIVKVKFDANSRFYKILKE